jgi:hypothetical protein
MAFRSSPGSERNEVLLAATCCGCRTSVGTSVGRSVTVMRRVLLPHFIGHLLPELHHRYVMYIEAAAAASLRAQHKRENTDNRIHDLLVHCIHCNKVCLAAQTLPVHEVL